MEAAVRETGEFTEIHDHAGRRYKVQRHFIALHSVKADQLEDLARDGLVEKLT